jgi:hypothetical protein
VRVAELLRLVVRLTTLRAMGIRSLARSAKIAKSEKINKATDLLLTFAIFVTYRDVGNADLVGNIDRPTFARDLFMSIPRNQE